MKRPVTVVGAAAAAVAAQSLFISPAALAVELYNNGTFVTGTSPGGNTISEVPAGYDTFGLVVAGYNSVAPQRVADNFIVPSGGWDLDTLTVYAYEGGGATNTFSNAYVAIFDCDPTGTEDLTPRWGSLDPFAAPNAFVAQQPLNIFRVAAIAPEGTTRHIHGVTLTVADAPVLPPGEYWVAWGLHGSFSDAVVAAVPVTPVPAGADGLSWGRTRYAVPGRENFWQYADGNIVTGEDPNLIQPYDHAFKLDGTTVAVNQWNGGSGAYDTPGNWSQGVVPDDNDAVANFTAGSGGTVTLGSVTLLGKINFNASGSYVLTGGATINLSTLVSDCAQVNVFAGNHTIDTPVAAGEDVHLNVVPSDSTLTIRSELSNGTIGKLVKRGAGTAEIDRVRMGELRVRAGTLRIAPNGTVNGTSRVGALDVEIGLVPRGKLDVTNNAFVVDYDDPSPIDRIRALIVSAYNGGSWNGNGITSSNANANNFGIGYAEASALTSVPAIFGSVDSTAVLFRFTRYGDANLDGTVNLSDFNRLAANFGATDGDWARGDFNYDGNVNLADFNRLAANFGLSAAGPDVTPQDWSALAAAVPEPTALLALTVAPLTLLRRRRRAGRAVPGT